MPARELTVAPNPHDEGDLHRWVDASASFFQILADPTRLSLFATIALRPGHVRELARRTELEPSLVSHHLSDLAANGLVEYERVGTRHLFRLGRAIMGTARSNGILKVTIKSTPAMVLIFDLPDRPVDPDDPPPVVVKPRTRKPDTRH